MYKYQYNGKCYENCSNGTINNNYICEDENRGSFKLNTTELDFNYTLFIKEVDPFVQSYSAEFSFTDSNVTKYENDEYDAIVYKDEDFISELQLYLPSINLGKCYNKIQEIYNISHNSSY